MYKYILMYCLQLNGENDFDIRNNVTIEKNGFENQSSSVYFVGQTKTAENKTRTIWADFDDSDK